MANDPMASGIPLRIPLMHDLVTPKKPQIANKITINNPGIVSIFSVAAGSINKFITHAKAKYTTPPKSKNAK